MKVFLTRPTYQTEVIGQMLADEGIELIQYEKDEVCPPEELLQWVRVVDGLLTHTEDNIDQALIKQAGPKLRVIANMGIGYSNIDIEAAGEAGIAVTNTPVEAAFDATAEATVAHIVAIARRIPALHVERRELQVDPTPSFLRPTAVAIRNKVLGVIGLGRIGSRVATMMHHGFGNTVLYHDHTSHKDLEQALQATRVELEELVCRSDFICLNLPLTESTANIINRELIGKMKPGAVIVNMARDGLIDEPALVEALNVGKLHGAGLDVYTSAVNDITWDNIALTSHFANFEHEAYLAMSTCVADNVIGMLKHNTPVSAVNSYE